jgi:hypothetical protein
VRFAAKCRPHRTHTHTHTRTVSYLQFSETLSHQTHAGEQLSKSLVASRSVAIATQRLLPPRPLWNVAARHHSRHTAVSPLCESHARGARRDNVRVSTFLCPRRSLSLPTSHPPLQATHQRQFVSRLQRDVPAARVRALRRWAAATHGRIIRSRAAMSMCEIWCLHCDDATHRACVP